MISFNVLKLVTALLEYIDLFKYYTSVSEGGLAPRYNVRGPSAPLAPLSAAYDSGGINPIFSPFSK